MCRISNCPRYIIATVSCLPSLSFFFLSFYYFSTCSFPVYSILFFWIHVLHFDFIKITVWAPLVYHPLETYWLNLKFERLTVLSRLNLKPMLFSFAFCSEDCMQKHIVGSRLGGSWRASTPNT